MFPKFTPKSPDPFMRSGMDAADAKFGHLNAVVDYINADQGVVSDGVTIIGTGTEEDPLIAIGGEGGAGVKTAIAFSTDHLSSTGNEYVIGNVVWYNGNIYRCIANNDSLIPTSTEYWTNLGAGFQAIESPVDWNSTSGNNQILNKPTNFGSPSLQDVTDTGNTTTNDISFGVGAKILMSNGAKIQEGTTDAILGGNGGIALRCSIDYELKWEAGRLFVMHQDGFIIREVRYTGISEPTEFDDVTIGFVQNSRWVLDNGTTYICTDPTEDNANWILYQVNEIGITDVDGYAVLQANDSFGLKVKTDNAAFQGIYYNEDNSANYTDNSLIARKDAPKVLQFANTPCDEGENPTRLGDIYIDSLNNKVYLASNINTCTDWVKIESIESSTYNPAVILPVVNQIISFIGAGIYTRVGNEVSCKIRVSLTFGGVSGYNYNFYVSLPIPPTNPFGINTQILGSVIPFGNVTLWHKVNHTSIIANVANDYAEINVEVDNSMNGVCQFVLDFSYLVQ